MNRPAATRLPFLFSPTVDLLTFGGSALLALAMLPIGAALGILHSDTPRWTWLIAILLIDVAHVYATGFRVYFDISELRRRPWLYSLTPLLALLVGAAVYSESVMVFWSLLAYLAVFHFVRQQYGWVALYRSRENDREATGWWIDAAAIYLATLYPLVYWHANLPRKFHWFTAGDFISLPPLTATLLEPIYWTALGLYAVRAIHRGLSQGRWNPGKDLVVLTTAVCWYVGIISLNSDYAFTITNVIIHGIPYMVLIYWYRWHRPSGLHPSSLPASSLQPSNLQVSGNRGADAGHSESGRGRSTLGRLSVFLGAIWMLAYAEELIWDCGLWHQHEWLFGWASMSDSTGSRGWAIGGWEVFLAPLLAVPQITHYVLDGFIWRRSAR